MILGDYIVTISRICDEVPPKLILAIEEKIKKAEVGVALGNFIGYIATDHRDRGALRKNREKKEVPLNDSLSGKKVSDEWYDVVWNTISEISPNFTNYLSSNANVKVASEILSIFINKIMEEKDYERIALCMGGIASQNTELSVYLCLCAINPKNKELVNKVIYAIFYVNPKSRERFEWIEDLGRKIPGSQIEYDFEQSKIIISEMKA